MKRSIILASLLVICGCASDGKVRNIIRDPHFTEYKETMDQVERDYLHKNITYAEYLEKKKAIEENYEQDANPWNAAVQNPDPATAKPETSPSQ